MRSYSAKLRAPQSLPDIHHAGVVLTGKKLARHALPTGCIKPFGAQT